MTRLRVLSVASELFPYVKTGGLADVAGALPAALAAEGVEMVSLLPCYPSVAAALPEGETVHRFDELFGGAATLRRVEDDNGHALLLLDAPHLYARPGSPYASPQGTDWPDNAVRFAALCWAATEIGRGCLAGFTPAVVHAHDWQAGLAPAYLTLSGGRRPATVMTVHNLAYQGQFPPGLLHTLRLPDTAFGMEGVEYYGGIGFLKAGLHYADRITTVSPTYAREIQTPEGGMGLDGLLRRRAAHLVGIVNGIDEVAWDPATDAHLAAPYSARRLVARATNKHAVRERFGLDHDVSPLFCVISRLAAQKGIDLVLALVSELVGQGAQLAVLGSGDAALEQGWLAAARAWRGRVGVVLGYDEALSHLLQGGADAILIPSRFEPCGLTQMYGLRYGTVPIVARVGGLADTVIDANEAALEDGVATGIVFAPVTAEALRAALLRALALFRAGAPWQAMQRRGMSRRNGWDRRAAAYAAVYREAVAAAV